MAVCKHKNVVYVGKQETAIEGKFIDLYQCVHCGSTITLENIETSKTVDNPAIEDEITSKK